MAQKQKYPTLVTPVGTAAFAWLSKPDTGKKYSDDKYKVTLVLKKGVAKNDQFAEEMNAAHEKVGGEANYAPVKDGDKYNAKRKKKGKEVKEEFNGMWLATFKSRFEPQLLQKGTKEPLSEEDAPRSGDLIKVAFAAVPYDSGDNQGVSLQMRAVKLMERRARADYSDAFGDDEEGDSAPQGNGGGDDNDDF